MLRSVSRLQRQPFSVLRHGQANVLLHRVCSPRQQTFAAAAASAFGAFESRCTPVHIPTSASLVNFLRERGAWSAHPDKVAIIDESADGAALTYGELDARINGCAHALRSLGFCHGDVLHVHLHNCTEFVVAYMAAATLGGLTSPSNPAYTADELATQLDDSGAKILLSSEPYRACVTAAVARQGGEITVSFIEEEGSFARAAPRADAAPPDVPIRPDRDLVVLPYSSGTTGRPKGVMLR